MFNPSLHTLHVQAHAEDLQRAARIYHHGRDGECLRTPPLSTPIKRAINRVFAGAPTVRNDVAPVHGFELFSRSFAATLRPRT